MNLFERAIIEAYKQDSNKLILEKLIIAYDEIKILIKELNDHNKREVNEKNEFDDKHYSNFILNSNIIDKLRRLVKREHFCVKMVIAKIYDKLLEEEFLFISDDIDILIQFINDILILIEDLKSTNIISSLQIKCLKLLDFLKNNESINSDQKIVIIDLIKNLPIKLSSEECLNFDESYILSFLKSDNLSMKQEGISLLMEIFSKFNSLEEQFQILSKNIPKILKQVLHKPDLKYKDLYFQIGHFLCSMIYNFSFNIDSNLEKFDWNSNNIYFMKDELLIKSHFKEKFNFLNNLKYELTNQKDVLLNSNFVLNLCLQVTRTISVFENVFDIQYVCFVILKRLYFTFPQERHLFNDDIIVILINICQFNGEIELKNSEDCKYFIKYLLKNDNSDLNKKLIFKLEDKSILISEKFNNCQNCKYENLKLTDFNLRIGFPMLLNIEAGKEEFKYIEIKDNFSLVYIGFANQANDINFKILKYIEANEKSYFKEIFKINKYDGTENPLKVIILISEPCFLKVIWDNTYSWITNKKLRIRISVLKPQEYINIEEFKAFLLDTEEIIIKESSEIELKNIDKNNKERSEFVIKYKDKKKKYDLISLKNYYENKICSNVLKLYIHLLVIDNNKFVFINNTKNKVFKTDSFFEKEKIFDLIGNIISFETNSKNINEIEIDIIIYHCKKIEDIIFDFHNFNNSIKFKIINLELSESFSKYKLFKNMEMNNNSNFLFISFLEDNNPNFALYYDDILYDSLNGGLDFNSNSTNLNIKFENTFKFIQKIQVLFGESNIFILSLPHYTNYNKAEYFIKELNEKIKFNNKYQISLINEEEFIEAIGLIPNFNN